MNDIKQEFLELPEVKRIKELESYIDQNPKINSKLKELKQKQQQMVHAKEFQQHNQYHVYKKEYDSIYEELLDLPFVEEYLELLDIVNQTLVEFTSIIQKKINESLTE